METSEFFVTFGVQYTGDPKTGDVHPLGLSKDNYVVIEAPNFAMAQRIAGAIFEQKYSFIYDEDNFIKDGTRDRWYSHDGAEALRIAWASTRIDTPIGASMIVHAASYEAGWQDGIQEGTA